MGSSEQAMATKISSTKVVLMHMHMQMVGSW